ncbi:hypothetical protein Herbaro_06525 [Herbaspirillum sp. WKF16]|jgi:LPS O-antigen subunit length determinant protein (WzzB/FepE family)|uniref:hypothetical protein n=1 Tax=Herbaspirillum sp. WKF16 TaxID=3028312 RepID=UPI0023A945D7|nr:hypothetical protein [Herbaspirillum sp. WKF16]WDZ97441.1 hypothetical protein Herbaro_06525 [Herbaspirillum sp. WKF16]
MPIDLAAAVSAVIPNPNGNTTSTGKATDPDQVRRTDEARMAQQAEQRRLEEIQADEKRAETAREDRNRREQISRNATGEIIGTTVNSVA